MTKNSRPNSQLTAVNNVLQSLLENGKSPLSPGYTRWRLEQEWVQVVGEQLSQNTLQVGYEKGTLLVWVPHPSWIQQLKFFEHDIVKKVNDYLGFFYASRLRFTLDGMGIVSAPK
jgi:hypothetical protein